MVCLAMTTKIKEIELPWETMTELLERAKANAWKEGDHEIVSLLIETFIYLKEALENKTISMLRLLRIIFGATTESSENVLEKEKDEAEPAAPDKGAKKRKGHGRNGGSAYSGAKRVPVSHSELTAGSNCPLCLTGTLYKQKVPGRLLRFTGNAPVEATVYELEKLRCNLCGKVFTASVPEEAGDKKYDERGAAMIALLKYGSGAPFYRIEGLQASLGIPLPASTQWEIVESVADEIYPAFEELKRQAAQGEVIHNDDTTIKILNHVNKSDDEERKGLFTSGFVSTVDNHKIGLFLSGQNHAGENMDDLLSRRAEGLEPPIRMCDASGRNVPKSFKTILSNCLVHARRNFVDVYAHFPKERRYVIETLGHVYKNDELAKEKNLDPQERLLFHQTHSGPLMEALHGWLNEQFAEKKVEPNSGLGKAISYMLNHWPKLTRFLEVANAPLDNNICEQALKKAVLHRKNSLFYKTDHGAYIGDLFMSLIHTCKLGGINPFDYLTELQKHSSEVFKNPGAWMPWNYQEACALPP